MSHLGHRTAALIHWKADAPKTCHCLVRILVQKHNWLIFLLKWASRGRCSQWRSLSGHVERIFVSKEEGICNIWFQQDGATCHTDEAENRIISRRADVGLPPRSCNLPPLGYYLWGAVKDKCYADNSRFKGFLKIFVKLLVKYSCAQSIMWLKIGPVV